MSTLDGLPPAQHLQPEAVLAVMAHEGQRRLVSLDGPRVLALAMLGGAFITVGALFSVLLAQGAQPPGLLLLLLGLGFSTGFFFVVLSHAVLFTESNVVLPATVLHTGARLAGVVRFWALAWVGNLFGTFLTATAIGFVAHPAAGAVDLLDELVAAKMAFRAEGTAAAWLSAVVSGVLANWLVGMAAFFALMGRTILGKYIPVLLAVTAFVAAGFQHSPANMGYFSLARAFGLGVPWSQAFAWSLIPAGIGNIIGGGLLVVLPLSWAFRSRSGA